LQGAAGSDNRTFCSLSPAIPFFRGSLVVSLCSPVRLLTQVRRDPDHSGRSHLSGKSTCLKKPARTKAPLRWTYQARPDAQPIATSPSDAPLRCQNRARPHRDPTLYPHAQAPLPWFNQATGEERRIHAEDAGPPWPAGSASMRGAGRSPSMARRPGRSLFPVTGSRPVPCPLVPPPVVSFSEPTRPRTLRSGYL